MTKKKVLVAYTVVILSAMLLCSCTRPLSESESEVQIGQVAPNFKLAALGGGEISLDQYRGKIVLLDFWATWCTPCRMTMPVLARLEKEYPGTLVLLAINLQEPKDEVREYVLTEGINSMVLLDEEGYVGAAYGTGSIPMQVLIDKSGVIRRIQLGYSPSMASQLRADIEKLR